MRQSLSTFLRLFFRVLRVTFAAFAFGCPLPPSAARSRFPGYTSNAPSFFGTATFFSVAYTGTPFLYFG